MAHKDFRITPYGNFCDEFVLIECFKSQQLTEGAINYSQKFSALPEKDITDTPLSEYCYFHPRMKLDLYCQQCGVDVCRDCTITMHRKHEYTASSDKIREETRRIANTSESVLELLNEIKQAISEVKEMKQSMKNRKDNNINMTREVFGTLRKCIDEREEQTIGYIKEVAYKREKTLELQLQSLMILWTQLKNCLEVTKKINEKKMRAEELTKRRMILEQQSDHLKETKRKSRLELCPVMSEQKEAVFENMEQITQAISKLGYDPVEPSKCEAVIPPVDAIVKKKATFIVILKNKDNNPVTNSSEELNVFIESIRDGEATQVRTIKEVGDGRYEASFIVRRCGYHLISITADGNHISGSPYKILADRDYNKITEQDCTQVVTHYGGNKFGGLYDVTVTPNNEVIIIDYGRSCVVVLDNKLNLLKVIGQGSGSSRLVSPYGVAVTDNVIAVSDWGSSHQVKKYSLQGELLSVIGCYGNNNGQFDHPRGLAFNSNKFLYVVDVNNCRVQVFQPDDRFAFSFGNRGNNPGQFQYPVRIAIDLDNNVLVTDYNANCIKIFTQNGQFMQTINSDSPCAITVSPTGYLITGHDGDDNKIRVWSPTYQLINQFGKSGSKEGKFYGIRGMAVDSSGSIYVAEWNNERLQVISNSYN